MKRTLKKLTRKMIFSCFYLPLIYMTVISLFGNYDTLGDRMTDDITISAFLRIVLILLMLIHWFYGAIYYPQYYRRYIKTLSRGKFTQNFPTSDLSSFRGYLALMIFIGIIILQFLNYRGLNYIGPDLVWLALLYVASFASRTDKMFCKRTTKINRSIIINAKFKEKPANKYRNSYDTIAYLVTRGEWGQNTKDIATEAYCQEIINDYLRDENLKKTREKEKENADILSTQLAEKIKS